MPRVNSPVLVADGGDAVACEERPAPAREPLSDLAQTEIMLTLARLEHQALGRRHFTVLDTLLRLRRRFLHSARMQVVRVE